MKRRDFLKGMLGVSMAALAPMPAISAVVNEGRPKPGTIIELDPPLKNGEIVNINGIKVTETISYQPHYMAYLISYNYFDGKTHWVVHELVEKADNKTIAEVRVLAEKALRKVIDNG